MAHGGAHGKQAGASGSGSSLQERSAVDPRYGGVAFTSDFTSGTGNSESRIFAAGGPNVIDEERKLIEKIFGIVDRDNNGTIDTRELEEMFAIFHHDTRHLKSAIGRIMSNVDRNADGMISPTEFYELLSQKFEKEDVERNRGEVVQVFRKMCGEKISPKGDPLLDVDNLHKISQNLGEVVPKEEIQEMINMFSQEYQSSLKQTKNNAKKKGGGGPNQPKEVRASVVPTSAEGITEEDFLNVMKIDLDKTRKGRR